MGEFEQYCVSGLSSAALYAMLAACWSLAWSVSRSLNLMLGAYAMVGGVVFGWLFSNQSWPVIPALALTLAAAGALGVATEFLMRFCRIGPIGESSGPGTDDVSAGGQLIVSLAGVLATQQAVEQIWGSGGFVAPNFVGGSPWRVASADVNRQVVILLAVAIVSLSLIELILHRTKAGRGMRACGENAAGALACGVSPRTMRLGVTVATAVLAGLAAAVALPVNAVDYQSSITFALFGLVAAIVGGLGSVPGAALGGLLVGMAQALISGYISSARSSAIVYSILIVVLLAAPRGLAALIPPRSQRTRAAALRPSAGAADGT